MSMKNITAQEHAYLTYFAQEHGFEWYDDPEEVTCNMEFYKHAYGYKVVVSKYEAFDREYLNFAVFEDWHDKPSFHGSRLSTKENISKMFEEVTKYDCPRH